MRGDLNARKPTYYILNLNNARKPTKHILNGAACEKSLRILDSDWRGYEAHREGTFLGHVKSQQLERVRKATGKTGSFKHKSLGDISSLPYAQIKYRNEAYSTFDSTIRKNLMLKSNVQRAWFKHIIRNLTHNSPNTLEWNLVWPITAQSNLFGVKLSLREIRFPPFNYAILSFWTCLND